MEEEWKLRPRRLLRVFAVLYLLPVFIALALGLFFGLRRLF